MSRIQPGICELEQVNGQKMNSTTIRYEKTGEESVYDPWIIAMNRSRVFFNIQNQLWLKNSLLSLDTIFHLLTWWKTHIHRYNNYATATDLTYGYGDIYVTKLKVKEKWRRQMGNGSGWRREIWGDFIFTFFMFVPT